ncbi:hypothetical protein LCGC14_1918580 [marine sediment metagenome]|uniref:Uncharacterized protein n=1 Tax=marine sediment metagenome TaxID=412755 RepID=A0A0F9I5G3_9ZZZZ
MPPDAQNPGGQPGDTPPVGGQPVVEEPKWLGMITDETARGEAKKAYMLQEDYTKKTTALSDEKKGWETERTKYQDIEKQYDTIQAWYQKDYLPFHARITPKWKEVDAYLKGEAALPVNGAPTAPANPQDPFDGYDLLSGTEQANKMAEHLKTTYFNPKLQEITQQRDQFYAQKEQGWAGFVQRYNAINNDAIQIALKEHKEGRDFPIQQYVEEQLKIYNGQVDAPALAFQKVTGDHRQKDMEKQWYDAGVKDAEQKALNTQQNPGALLNSTVPIFKQPAKTRDEINSIVQKVAQDKGIPWT